MYRLLVIALLIALPLSATSQTKSKGILLENLTWIEAEKVLEENTVVVVPLGDCLSYSGSETDVTNTGGESAG